MKREAIYREVRANIRAGTTRAGLLAALFALVLTASAGADLLQIRQLTASAEAWQKAGASTWVMRAEGRIDGGVCRALSNVEGVNAAGALRMADDSSELVLAQLPAAPVPVAEVTPRFERLLGIDTGGETGIILSREAAEPLGLNNSGSAALRDGRDVPVAGVYDYPSDGRVPGYGYLALAPVASDTPFDECWIDVFPHSEVRTSLLYSAVLPSTSTEEDKPSLSQLNSRLGQSFDGPALMASRITRFAPLVAFLGGVGLGFAALWRRRLEFASNLHAGMNRANGRAIVFLETAAWGLMGAFFASCLLALLIASDSSADRLPLALIAGRSFVAGSFGLACGSGLAWWRTREEQLFRYFKER